MASLACSVVHSTLFPPSNQTISSFCSACEADTSCFKTDRNGVSKPSENTSLNGANEFAACPRLTRRSDKEVCTYINALLVDNLATQTHQCAHDDPSGTGCALTAIPTSSQPDKRPKKRVTFAPGPLEGSLDGHPSGVGCVKPVPKPRGTCTSNCITPAALTKASLIAMEQELGAEFRAANASSIVRLKRRVRAPTEPTVFALHLVRARVPTSSALQDLGSTLNLAQILSHSEYKITNNSAFYILCGPSRVPSGRWVAFGVGLSRQPPSNLLTCKQGFNSTLGKHPHQTFEQEHCKICPLTTLLA